MVDGFKRWLSMVLSGGFLILCEQISLRVQDDALTLMDFDLVISIISTVFSLTVLDRPRPMVTGHDLTRS